MISNGFNARGGPARGRTIVYLSSLVVYSIRCSPNSFLVHGPAGPTLQAQNTSGCGTLCGAVKQYSVTILFVVTLGGSC